MSTDDCRNDCAAPLAFPRKIENRPGLAHIKYRVGNYADIREALLRNLDKDETLAAWTHRGADDPGIALLEGAAILGDILTFYQELYANEAYLRTARWRESIADLVRLVGYRLSPGLGGRAVFAFEAKGAKAITVPKNFPVKAEVTGLDKAADFETTAALTAFPWLSRFNLFRPLVWPNVTAQTTEFYIQTPDQLTAPVELKQGDRLLVGDVAGASPKRLDNAEVVVVDSTRVLHGVTLVKIKGALKRTAGASDLTAFKLGRAFHHFGHAGAPTLTRTTGPAKSTSKTSPPDVNGNVTTEITSEPNTEEVRISFFRRVDGTTVSGEESTPVFHTVLAQSNLGYVGMPVSGVSGFGGSGFGGSGLGALGSMFLINNSLSNSLDDVSVGQIDIAQGRTTATIVSPSLPKEQFPLDAEVQDLPNGVPLLVQATLYKYSGGSDSKEFTFIGVIKSVRSDSMTWGTTTGPTSVVTLNAALDASSQSYNFMDIRQALFHEALSPQLTLRAAPHEDAAVPQGFDLLFYGTDAQAQDLNGRRLFFEPPGKKPFMATVTAVETETSPQLAARERVRLITLGQEFDYADFPNEKPTANVYGNLVDATQGKLEAEVPLGNGDSRQVFQLFKLPKSPLTYLLSLGASPPETPKLEIYVNDRLWTMVPTLFGHKYDEEIYIVREDAAGESWVQFGDGKTGARLPSGVKNVKAKYRTGTGAYGELKPDTKVQGGARLDKLDKIQMPGVAEGGSTPEDGDNAREAAPGKIQSLGRLVSLKDFESETLAISGVTSASASWEIVNNIASVFITVLMETGRELEVDAVGQVVAGFDLCRGPHRFPVAVREGRLQYVSLNITYGIDPVYREELVTAAIRRALGATNLPPVVGEEAEGAAGSPAPRGLFSTRARRFGEAEYATRIEAAVQGVAGVLWAEVNDFTSLGEAFNPPFDPEGDPFDPATLGLPATKTPNAKIAPDRLHILALHSKHLVITATAEAKEVCA